MKYALVDNFGLVRNIILWDGKTEYAFPPGWTVRPAVPGDAIQ